MDSLSTISCLMGSELARSSGAQLKVYRQVFEQYKGTPFYEFAGILMRHMPENFSSSLSKDEMTTFYKHLFTSLDERKKKKVSVKSDAASQHLLPSGNFTIFTVASDNKVFIFDSVLEYLQSINEYKSFIVNPVFSVERNDSGDITSIGEYSVDAKNELLMVVFIENIGKAEVENIKHELEAIYENVIAAVDDFSDVRNTVSSLKDDLASENKDVADFIQWLIDDNYIFQGLKVVDTDRDTSFYDVVDKGIFTLPWMDFNYTLFVESIKDGTLNTVSNYPVVIEKSERTSKVKRRCNLDRIVLFKEVGNKIRLLFLTGLFADSAYSCSRENISIIRDKIKPISSYFVPFGDTHKSDWIKEMLNNYPLVELFNLSQDDLINQLEMMMTMPGANQVRLASYNFRPFKNFFFFMAMPFAKYSHELLDDVGDVLKETFGVQILDISVRHDKSKRCFLYYNMLLNDVAVLDVVDEKELKRKVIALFTDWDSSFYKILSNKKGSSAADIYAEYKPFFNEVYKSKNSPELAYIDLKKIIADEDISAIIHNLDNRAILRVYSNRKILLTELMPVIDNLGLEVHEQDIFEPAEGSCGKYINVVYFANIENVEQFIEQHKKVLPQLVTSVLKGFVENDRLNSLAILKDLNYRQIDILRTIAAYARQINSGFTVSSLIGAFTNNPDVAEKIVTLFELKFNPDIERASSSKLEEEIFVLIENVVSALEDKALRYFLQIVQATVRTNYYMLPTKNYISIKVKSCEMSILPAPRPMFEIYVHSASMEGIHLRGGKVARGGIRFSDRNSDFRTEILGLLKTQMIKNSVIVPVGSKGGFVVKKRFKDREEDKLNVITQYQTLIKGMLDITDNYVGEELIHPERVTLYDDVDPYLVVAADKGTATFSDIANGISADYGFWLDDAFASGGSTGYNHKGVGITARGAWENVKRLFLELGKDIQKEDFTVVGIGDMAGDVFGNGMLLSEHTKLIAAFNHMHIFLDPNPDRVTSFAERERLFENTSLTWKDYNRELISKGGGVYDRSSKRIELTPEVKEMLGCTTEMAVSGNELVKLILKAEVDLLWNGGIGTYVKASYETDKDVGDSANDDVRVDGKELKVKVVGEGGNLGFTQAGRVEYAQNGGKIYTDALDNSGGVDMSDHEVNLKIMFSQLLNAGLLKDVDERNACIKQITDSVTELVLATNYGQSLGVSCDLTRFDSSPVIFYETARYLKEEGGLDPKMEKISFINGDKGATTPELAVMMAFMKLHIYNTIESSLDLDNPLVRAEYLDYYPKSTVETFGDSLFEHKLMRQIAATVISNRTVNQTGVTFFYELTKSTGKPLNVIAEAYLLAEKLLGCKKLRNEICALDKKADAETQYRALIELERTLKVAVEWLAEPANYKLYCENSGMLEEVFMIIKKFMTHEIKEKHDIMAKEFIEGGLPEELAFDVCAVRFRKSAFDVFTIMAETGRDAKSILERYYEIDSRFGINLLLHSIKNIKIKDRWERINRDRLQIKLKKTQLSIACAYCAGDDNWLENVLESEKAFIKNYDKFREYVDKGDVDSLVPLNVIVETFFDIAERYGSR